MITMYGKVVQICLLRVWPRARFGESFCVKEKVSKFEVESLTLFRW